MVMVVEKAQYRRYGPQSGDRKGCTSKSQTGSQTTTLCVVELTPQSASSAQPQLAYCAGARPSTASPLQGGRSKKPKICNLLVDLPIAVAWLPAKHIAEVRMRASKLPAGLKPYCPSSTKRET